METGFSCTTRSKKWLVLNGLDVVYDMETGFHVLPAVKTAAAPYHIVFLTRDSEICRILINSDQMKKLTRKNLQAARGAAVDDILRFEAPKGRAKFILRVLYDNFFQAPKVNIVYLLFLILAASFDIAQGETCY